MEQGSKEYVYFPLSVIFSKGNNLKDSQTTQKS